MKNIIIKSLIGFGLGVVSGAITLALEFTGLSYFLVSVPIFSILYVLVFIVLPRIKVRKSDKTLLLILRDRVAKPDWKLGGLCTTIVDLLYSQLIHSDFNRLTYMVRSSEHPVEDATGYWWPKGEAKPRIEWLDGLISNCNFYWYEKVLNILK